ncbi:hypothetical protein HanXRQr2_Chr10g0449851 [Helianthus annuus]|uniref:Uncharacterized protein n=1 Tax=Helianthus annuus TaxID=4232 RepID=A0A251TKW9_HELAN|nr:hypothetical protein HanXRQr2_Chr10g0449851 [Helianthus annuus]
MMYTVYGWMERDSLFPYLVQKKKKTLIPNISQLSQLLQPTSSRSTAPRQSGIHRSTAPPHRHQDPPLSACIHRRPSTTHSTPAVQKSQVIINMSESQKKVGKKKDKKFVICRLWIFVLNLLSIRYLWII